MSIFCILLVPSAAGKVLVRWARPALPPVKTLSVRDLVVSWNAISTPFLKTALDLGYRVYAEASLTEASAAAEVAAKGGLAGVVIDVENSERGKKDDVLRSLATAYPKLTILFLSSRGIEPQMRGRRARNKNGALQVTSPTSQPWIDSNLAAIRIERALLPLQVPLYTFPWDLSDPLRKRQGASAADFSLAVAEAGAFHGDLVLDLPENLQRALARNSARGLATWKKVKRYLEFWPQGERDSTEPLANVGIVMDDSEACYEAINLMARHNIQIRAMLPADLNAHSLDSLDVAVLFTALKKEQIGIISDYAAQGGIAILVDMRGAHPWESAEPLRRAEHSVTYAVGRGRVIELTEPVTDPETFARDVRRLMDNQEVLIGLWNSLTTVAALYNDPGGRETILELVNYSPQPVGIQIRVKGSFPSVRYESPERGCCESLTPEQRNGFTEFEVLHLVIGGRVHLTPTSTDQSLGPGHGYCVQLTPRLLRTNTIRPSDRRSN